MSVSFPPSIPIREKDVWTLGTEKSSTKGGPPRQFLANKRGARWRETISLSPPVHHPQESQSVLSCSSFSKRGNMGARGQSDDKFIFPPNLVCMSHLTKTCPPWNVRNGYFSGKRKHLCSNASSSGYLATCVGVTALLHKRMI